MTKLRERERERERGYNFELITSLDFTPSLKEDDKLTFWWDEVLEKDIFGNALLAELKVKNQELYYILFGTDYRSKKW